MERAWEGRDLPLRGEAAIYFLEGCRYLFCWSGWARNLGATFWARQCSTFGEVETYLWWGGPNFGEFRDLSLVGRQIHTVTFEGRGGKSTFWGDIDLPLVGRQKLAYIFRGIWRLPSGVGRDLNLGVRLGSSFEEKAELYIWMAETCTFL